MKPDFERFVAPPKFDPVDLENLSPYLPFRPLTDASAADAIACLRADEGAS